MKFYNCDIYRFKELVHNKKLVCFGAGKVLKNFISDYAEMHFEKDICYVADNQCEKIGNQIQIAGTMVSVISVSQLVEIKNIILFISCYDICGVYEQLNAYLELADIWCFAARFIQGETNLKNETTRRYPQSYRLTKKQLIPKKIHYCWFGGQDIPRQNRRWMESWKKFCPDYEIIRWDESNYDVTKNEYIYDAYRAEKWAFVSDYARLDVIYNHGGIYLDTDVELLRKLDELLYQTAFVGIDSGQHINFGGGFGAKKECVLVKDIRDLYLKLKFNNTNEDNLIAQPSLQKDYFNSKGYVNNGEYQIVDGLVVYPEKVLSAKCNYAGRILPNKHSFSIHHYVGSWTPELKKQRFIKNAELFEKYVVSI